jgi:hypothetical protein
MSQRASGYARRADEEYPTPAWVTFVIAEHLQLVHKVRHVWEPAAGHPGFADELTRLGIEVTATSNNFGLYAGPPHKRVEAIVTNPPYGQNRRGDLAEFFIRHAIAMIGPGKIVRLAAFLLAIDFDSAKSRADLFAGCPLFAGKIVLLDRVKWFEGPSSPSSNHAWFVWSREHTGLPWITYAGKPRPEKKHAFIRGANSAGK